jgi:large subunit ribosomal protein L21
MRVFKVFIFGLLYGFFMKIAFDRIYRENEIEDLRNENQSLQEYIRSLELRLQPKSAQPTATRSQSQPTEARAAAPRASERDDLKAIKGIGPAIEKKLNEAGIRTYAALAALSPHDLEKVLGNRVNRLQDENDLITQAKKLARRR